MKNFLLIMISFLCFSLSFLPALADIQIKGIQVDVQSKSGLHARELAIAEARRKAFVDLVQNNSAFFYDINAKGMPTDAALEEAVDTFEIESEKISAKQYIGTLSITFSEKGLDNLLNSSFSSEKNTQKPAEKNKEKSIGGHDVLFLPIYLTADESHLWHPRNPWHSYWQQVPKEEVFKTLIPLGDVQDILSTSIEDIMTGRPQPIGALLERYGKNRLVAAILRRPSQDHYELEITVKLFHKDRLVFSSEPFFVEGTTLEESFANGRLELIKVLQNYGASMKATKDGNLQTYHIVVTYNDFSQWQRIRRGLQMDGVQQFDITSLSLTSALIRVESPLPFNTLAREFGRIGLVLTEGTPGSFSLHVGFNRKDSVSSLGFFEQESSVNNQPRGTRALPPKIPSAFEVGP